MTIWIILGIVVVLIIAVIGMYNSLVQSKIKVDNAWSQIDVQLQRRFDLARNRSSGLCAPKYAHNAHLASPSHGTNE